MQERKRGDVSDGICWYIVLTLRLLSQFEKVASSLSQGHLSRNG